MKQGSHAAVCPRLSRGEVTEIQHAVHFSRSLAGATYTDLTHRLSDWSWAEVWSKDWRSAEV